VDRVAYPSDPTDEQWKLTERKIPPRQAGGHSRAVNIGDVVNGILYLVPALALSR
jgi:transposase